MELGLARIHVHSAIAGFLSSDSNTWRSQIRDHSEFDSRVKPPRSRSGLKIVIMFMAFRSIDRLRTNFSAIISLNTVLKVKYLNLS
jgi:hypothetical protein